MKLRRFHQSAQAVIVPWRKLLQQKKTRASKVIAEIMEEHLALKKNEWGSLMGSRWVPHDVRDKVIDYMSYYTKLTGIPLARFIGWLGISRGKYHEWHKRYGQGNNHNGLMPSESVATIDRNRWS